jgi:PTH1 family peptidyl-tRNA hydrolase
MKLVIGLGNPGRKYGATRHNVGFAVIDRFAERHGIGPWRRRFHGLTAEGAVRDAGCLLLKPQTYVNESGRAVRAAVDWRRIPLENVIVVCDDIHLPLGRLRVRGRGSSGGHNGLASIAAHLGSQEWARLRLGIGRVDGERMRQHVLSRFGDDEAPVIDEAVARSADALEVWLAAGVARCQNEFNAAPDAQQEGQSEEANA